MLRRLPPAFAAFALLAALPNVREPFPQNATDANWLQFDGRRSPHAAINGKNVSSLRMLWRVALPEPADGSPVYIGSVPTKTRVRDVVIVNTIGGRLVAVDANSGVRLWQTDPPAGPRWTTSSPAIDLVHMIVYGYSLDGYVHRYDVRNGQEMIGRGWPALITLKGDVEKGSSNLSIATAKNGHTYVYMTASAYPDPGDAGDYQGHLVTIDADSGEQHVFNALCSNRDMHFTDRGDDSDCASVQAGIWARAGAVYDAQTDRIFVTTGNGAYDAHLGGYNWGISVVALRPDGTTKGGTPIDSYTPENFQELTDEDLDLSSTTIEVLPRTVSAWPQLGVQSGKDGKLRLLNLQNLSGQGGPRHLGGELQVIDLPQGEYVCTQPTAWVDGTKKTWLFVANNGGTTAYQLLPDKEGSPSMVQNWTTTAISGTTPVVVNGIMYIASPHRLAALQPATGKILWEDNSIGDTHWQSPIVVNDTVYIEDNGGYLTAYSLTLR
jgi:outer membrane protein assembly factor BamB